MEKEQDPTNILEKPGSPPSDAKVINVISRGADICGTSYSLDKRHVKVSKIEREEGPQKNIWIGNNNKIIFDEHDRENIQDPHHEGLVITLYITNNFVRRILIDG